MTGAELKRIREAKGLTLAQMGLALGYTYDPALQCWRLESEYQGRRVPEWRASKAKEWEMSDNNKIPDQFVSKAEQRRVERAKQIKEAKNKWFDSHVEVIGPNADKIKAALKSTLTKE